MKTCLLSASFPPQRGGVGDYTCFLARALADRGNEVTVLTAVGELDNFLYPLPSSVNVHRVVTSWGIKGLPGVLSHLRKLSPQSLLIQYVPHAFDRRGITLALNLLPAITRAVSSIRVVANFHELFIPFDHSLKRCLGALWQRLMAFVLATGSHTLAVTTGEWQWRLARLGIRKGIHVIPVGSNIPLVAINEDERRLLRRQLLGGTDGLLLAGFGSRHDRDIPAALYGLQRLKRLGPVKLVWIGGGSPADNHRTNIEQAMRLNGLTEEDVKWTGQLPHPEVSRLLSICDLMVLPFIDGVSTRRGSAVTALQHGLPLLTTGGIRLEPWFVHRLNAYLIPAGNREALAEGLVELALSPDLRARLAQGARALYDAHFTWDVIAKQVESLAQ